MPLPTSLCLLALALAPQLPPGGRVLVHNEVAVARTQWVRASLPLPRGGYRCGARTLVDVGDGETTQVAPAVPLVRWEDDSIAVLQVHARVTVPALASRELQLRPRPGVAVDDAAFPRHAPLLPPDLLAALHCDVEDPWGRRHVAELVADATAAPGGVLVDSGAVRTVALRSRFRLASADGAPFLWLRGFLTTFHGERRAELVLLLDNGGDPLAGEVPLGPVRLRSFALRVTDPSLRFLPVLARENGLPLPEPADGGGFRQWLLPPGDEHYLGHGTAKAFRLHLFADAPTLDDAERTAAAFAASPLVAFPVLDEVRRSGAFGAHGGPAPCDAADPGRAVELFRDWQLGTRFGPFSGCGDPEGPGQQSSRQGDSALHDVLRWQSPPLLHIAEAMVLAHPLRPSPGPPVLPSALAPWRQGLGPRALRTPHGFHAVDYEHFSALLLYDYYWLTGDPLALAELRRLGRALRVLLPAVPFRTCRGEGQCLQSGVLIARATGDAALRAFLLAHCQDVLLPQLREAPAPAVLPQPPHAAAMDEPFDAPWQMAQLVRGLCALHAATAVPAVAAAARRTADAIAGPGWVDGEGPKSFVSAVDASRYTTAADPADRQGLMRMVTSALVLAAELDGDAAATQVLAARAAFLLETEQPATADLQALRAAAANPWLQVALDRRERAR